MDFYRHRLKHALWTWRESRWHKGGRRDRFVKDRVSSRSEKRSARQVEAREARAEAERMGDDAAMDAAMDWSTCPCSDCAAERARAAA